MQFSKRKEKNLVSIEYRGLFTSSTQANRNRNRKQWTVLRDGRSYMRHLLLTDQLQLKLC